MSSLSFPVVRVRRAGCSDLQYLRVVYVISVVVAAGDQPDHGSVVIGLLGSSIAVGVDVSVLVRRIAVAGDSNSCT